MYVYLFMVEDIEGNEGLPFATKEVAQAYGEMAHEAYEPESLALYQWREEGPKVWTLWSKCWDHPDFLRTDFYVAERKIFASIEEARQEWASSSEAAPGQTP
jgi:hypothetical protein